jgi:hypothetical protein
MKLENVISFRQREDVPSTCAEAARSLQSLRVHRATCSGVISTILVFLELGLELGVSLAYFFAFLRGSEVLLVLASLHFVSCLIRGAVHLLHHTSNGSGSDPQAELPFDARNDRGREQGAVLANGFGWVDGSGPLLENDRRCSTHTLGKPLYGCDQILVTGLAVADRSAGPGRGPD